MHRGASVEAGYNRPQPRGNPSFAQSFAL